MVRVGEEPTGVRRKRIAAAAYGPAERTLQEIRGTVTYIAVVLTLLTVLLVGAELFGAYLIYTSVDALRGTDVGP